MGKGGMKISSITKNFDGKEWCDVVFDNNTRWRPKLIDLAIIAKIIYEVEDNKYDPFKGFKGGEMVKECLLDSLCGLVWESKDEVDRFKKKWKLDEEYLNSLKS